MTRATSIPTHSVRPTGCSGPPRTRTRWSRRPQTAPRVSHTLCSRANYEHGSARDENTFVAVGHDAPAPFVAVARTYVARGEETPWRPGMRLGGMHDTVSHMSRMSESTRLSKTARSEGSEDFDSYPVVGNHGHEVIAEPARNLPAARNRRWGSPRHRGLNLLCIKHP